MSHAYHSHNALSRREFIADQISLEGGFPFLPLISRTGAETPQETPNILIIADYLRDLRAINRFHSELKSKINECKTKIDSLKTSRRSSKLEIKKLIEIRRIMLASGI